MTAHAAVSHWLDLALLEATDEGHCPHQVRTSDLLELREVEIPIPKESQVLVKVRAASINAADYRTMRANPFLIRLMVGGLLRPKDPRFGSDLAGQGEAG